MKKLSIITPTYNSSKFLSQCLESVKIQNLNKNVFEHIFVDWNSTDKTLDIINRYKQETWYDIHILNREPKWVYNALNQWVLEANWDYLFFLNSDDWLEPDVLRWYLFFIDECGKKDLYYADIIFNDWITSYKTDKSNLLNRVLFKIAWFNVLIHYPWVIVKKNTFIELWMFDESKKIASDYWMWLNMMKNGKKYIYYPKVVTTFRVHEWGLSSNSKNQDLSDWECKYFQRKYLPRYKKILLNLILFAWKIKRQIESIIKNKK